MFIRTGVYGVAAAVIFWNDVIRDERVIRTCRGYDAPSVISVLIAWLYKVGDKWESV